MWPEVAGIAMDEEGCAILAVIEADDVAHPPENDGGCPVFEWTGHHTGYGDYYAKDHQAHLERALRHFRDRFCFRREILEAFDRYIRIFHNGSTAATYYGDYVAVVTQTLWEAWGNTGHPGEADITEWQAYCSGDVYGYEIKRYPSLCTCDECKAMGPSTDVIDSCWGYYGDDYVAEAAREALGYFEMTYKEEVLNELPE